MTYVIPLPGTHSTLYMMDIRGQSPFDLREVICPGDFSGAFITVCNGTHDGERVVWCSKFGKRTPDCVQRCIPKDKRARHLLENELILLDDVLEQMPVGVLVIQLPSCRPLLVNRKLHEIFGEPPAGAAYVPEDSGFYPDGRPLEPGEWPLARSIHFGEVVKGEVIDFIGFHGQRGTVEVSSSPIRNNEGVSVAAVATFEDVTKREQLRRRLTELYHESHDSRRQIINALQREREGLYAVAQSFLGKIPDLPNLDLASLYRPANTAERMGGDFYDFLILQPGRLAVVIGDVCGKGIPAGVFTAATKYFLRAYASDQWEPESVLPRLNQALCREMCDVARFVTLFYGVLELDTGRFTYANAGHPPQVIHDAVRGVTVCLEQTGPVLGAFPDAEYQQRTLVLPPNSVLTLFTDGITEAGVHTRATWEELDVSRLVLANASRSAAEIAASIYESAEELANGCLSDDVALVVLIVPNYLPRPQQSLSCPPTAA